MSIHLDGIQDILHGGHVAQPAVHPAPERLPARPDDTAAPELREAAVIDVLEILPVLELQAREVLQPQRRELKGPHPPPAHQRRFIKPVAGDVTIVVELQDARPPARLLPLLERRFDPLPIPPGAPDVALEHRGEGVPRWAHPDAHRKELEGGWERGVVGAKPPADAEAATGLPRGVGKELELGGEVEELRKLRARPRLAVDHHHAPVDPLFLELGPKGPDFLGILHGVEVPGVAPEDKERFSGGRSQRGAKVDLLAIADARQRDAIERNRGLCGGQWDDQA
mmetsp:Transcript_26629/g.67668  ORF Transcript_26629/g.67668 Transcript_26629/m.67668 type:complete len:282 (-) Transcript_26629:92-937(-)